MDEFLVGGDDALNELRTAVGVVRRVVLKRGRGFWFGEGVIVQRLLFLQHGGET
jgi:hypothetical protein